MTQALSTFCDLTSGKAFPPPHRNLRRLQATTRSAQRNAIGTLRPSCGRLFGHGCLSCSTYLTSPGPGEAGLPAPPLPFNIHSGSLAPLYIPKTTSCTYRLPSRLRLNSVCQGLPATSIMGHPNALERETIDSVMSCWDNESGGIP